MKKPRIIIADDHVLIVEAFKNLLEPEFDVVESVADGRRLLEVAQQLKPDVVLLDIGLPLLNGAEAGRRLHEMLPRCKIVVITMYDDVSLSADALQNWAAGYLLKTSAASELLKAVREVLKGNRFVTEEVKRRLSDEFIRNPQGPREKTLTARQREVLRVLAEGHTMKEAAELLQVTPRTVAFHKYRIMEEFGLKSNSELVKFALREKIIGMN
jgi:DNA-binding NarL/FixJ family response regulator